MQGGTLGFTPCILWIPTYVGTTPSVVESTNYGRNGILDRAYQMYYHIII